MSFYWNSLPTSIVSPLAEEIIIPHLSVFSELEALSMSLQVVVRLLTVHIIPVDDSIIPVISFAPAKDLIS